MEVKILRFSDVPANITERMLREQFAKSGRLNQLKLKDGDGFVEFKAAINAKHAYIDLRPYFLEQGATLSYHHEEEEQPVYE